MQQNEGPPVAGRPRPHRLDMAGWP